MPDAHEAESSSRLSDLLPDPASVRQRLTTFGSSLTKRVRLLQQRVQSAGEGVFPDESDISYIEEGAETVTEEDVDTVVEEADAIEERFRENGPLGRLLDDGRLLLGFVQDARRGRYRRVPVWTLSAAAFTLLYVLNPFDAVPDALPFIGLLDDAAVVSACLVLLEQDLAAYRHWRENQIRENSASSSDESRRDSGAETSG